MLSSTTATYGIIVFALLASLGHDMRTPLTGIQGAAGTLRTGWTKVPEATRADLLDSIEQDVGRVPLGEAAHAAATRLAKACFIAINIPQPELMALADPALLEQVLVNVLVNAAKNMLPKAARA